MFLCALLVIGNAHRYASAEPDTLRQAKNAYTNLDLDAARIGFKAVIDDVSATKRNRAEAARRLAVIAWRFDQDFAAAHTYCDDAEKLADDVFETVLERTRVLIEDQRYKEARQAGVRAIGLAKTREETIEATVMASRVVFEQATTAIEAASQLNQCRNEIRGAILALKPIIDHESGHLEPSRLALGLALLNDDGPTALAAWRSYVWIPPSGTDNPLMEGPYQTLNQVLPTWRGPEASVDERKPLVSALAASGFFEFASWMILDPRVDKNLRIDQNPAFMEIVAFQEYRHAVRLIAEDFYRRFARGDVDTAELERHLRDHARTLWKKLKWRGQPPRFSDAAFSKGISERFNTEMKLEGHYGVLCVHMGQRVVDRRWTVEQYGRRAEVRFVALDQLVSNGYDTWFWDGSAATGGWVDGNTVIQIRPAYCSGPLKAWSSVSDVEQHRRLKEQIAREAEGDEIIARENPHAYMPGMSLRMRLKANEELLVTLKAEGLDGNDLRLAFITEVERQSQQSSIFAHEGRHALERRNVPKNWFRRGSEKEFLAKLSEVALADNPRRAITGGILSANIGGDSSHGQANKRIMKGLVDWMKNHQNEVTGFDRSRAHLPQLDLLTDGQLRAAFRAMDPWAD